METVQNIFQSVIIQRLGWTLVHFVWQGAAIGFILAILLKLLRKSSANLRYIIACMTLAVIVLMPLVTIRMVDVSINASESTKPIPFDLDKAGADTQTVVEIPQPESPAAQAAVTPRVSLKDRFIEAVEPALPYIVVGWLMGVFALSLWHLSGWTQLQRLRRQMVKQVAPTIKSKLQQLSSVLGIKRTIGLMESALVQVPTVVGHLKPVILLPASALTGLSSEQIEAILAHELAHIKRCDYLVNMLQTVVEILGFYHPAVWWVSHKIRVERENCCDDLAVSISGDRVCYAKALTTMEEIRADQAALAVAASGGSLFDRIRRLIGKDIKNNEKFSWLPSVIVILIISSLLIPISFAMSSRPKTDIEPAAKNGRIDINNDIIRVYQVNRNVSDFPDTEDFSTPESAYAAINRVMAADDYEGWQRVSVKRIAERLAKDAQVRKKKKVDSEWAKVVLNARILEVRIKDDIAVVIAKFAQTPEGKPINEPVDYRHLELEDGKWLNAGEDRYDSIEQAREKFAKMVEKQLKATKEKLRIEQKYSEALDKPEMLLGLAEELFDKLRKADYEKVLSYYDEKTNKWHRDGWKKLELDYMVHTDWPSFALWICRTFKENPIISVELGELFLSDEEIWDKKGFPTVPYKLTLADGRIITGELPFDYEFDEGRWQPFHGIDWHLQDEPIKSLETQSADSSSAAQILTSGYILSVPEDLPQLKEIISDDKAKTKVITPEKLEEFLDITRTVPGARVIAAPKLVTNDGEIGEIRTEMAEDFESIKLNIKNTVQPDKKTLRVELDFEYSCTGAGRQETSSISIEDTLLSEHAMAVTGVVANKGNKVLLLVKPEILEYGNNVPETNEDNNQAVSQARMSKVLSKKVQIVEKSTITDKPKDSNVSKADTRVIKGQDTDATKTDIIKRLQILHNQRDRVQRDLDRAERALEDVRAASGITDLEERSYPHPITARLTRLQKEGDDCVLEISQLRANIENLRRQKREYDAPSEELKKAHADLIVLQEKLKELEKMLEEAKAEKKNLDLARTQYRQRASIRDERRAMLLNINSQIEKLRIMYDEAESSISEKEPEAAKRFVTSLWIEISEDDEEGPKDVSLKIPLVGSKAANTMIPEQARRQMHEYGITLEGIIKSVENGLKPTVLLDVTEKNRRVKISLE